jgi:hypothetical protein
MKSRRIHQSRRRSGQSLLEFTLAAIPTIFLLISVEEIARGMWIYATLAHAVKEGTRYAIVHGADCVQADSSCAINVGQVASQIHQSGLGLDTAQLSVVLQTTSGSQSCAPISSCLSSTTSWPASPDNAVGLPVNISATYPFNSALSMFVPHAGAVSFGQLTFASASQEEIRY